MSSRAEIPPELADRVLFDADRTCCICREKERKVKIHHIDGNHANNVYENLAALCDDCHIDVHARLPFARNIGPGQVELYNNDWREIVRQKRARPATDAARFELEGEVFITLAMMFTRLEGIYSRLTLNDNDFAEALKSDSVSSTWEAWEAVASEEEFSQERWQQLRVLFVDGIGDYIEAIERFEMMYGGLLDFSFRTLLIRTCRNLSIQTTLYEMIPQMMSTGGDRGLFPNSCRNFFRTISTLQNRTHKALSRRLT